MKIIYENSNPSAGTLEPRIVGYRCNYCRDSYATADGCIEHEKFCNCREIQTITEDQKQKYLERTKAEYAGGQWHIWSDFVGGDSAVGDTIEVAARNYARGVAETFNNRQVDWELFFSQPPL